MTRQTLSDLYDASQEDLLYGIGRLELPDGPSVPLIQIHYGGWSREQLLVVRKSLASGLVLTIRHRDSDTYDLHLSTREQVTIEAADGDHTSVLRAPAWDASLQRVADQVIVQFTAQRRRHGGYLVLLLTPAWEFLAAASDESPRVRTAPLMPRSYPIPRD